MSDPVLVIFDVDGTIFDSQHVILKGFERAFARLELPMPARERILYTVGLSLDRAIAHMAPNLNGAEIDAVCRAYVHEFADLREARLPFFPGMRRLIGALTGHDHVILAVATGKSRRGLDPILRGAGMETAFLIKQTADVFPSKPSPDMILDALDRTGIEAGRAVIIGDTSFDVLMGKAAAIKSIGVTWGYHGEAIRDAEPDGLARHASDVYGSIQDWQWI